MSRSREGTRYTDEVLSLDVRELARQGVIEPVREGVVTWLRDGEAIATVHLTIEPGSDGRNPALVLTYARGSAGGELVPIRDRFALEATPCGFGGQRWWLRCRTCGDRVAVVYAASFDHRFVCRRCGQLAYRSTRIDELGRIDRRRLRLAARLGCTVAYPRERIWWRHLPCPEGMRPATHERLTDEGQALELRAMLLWTEQLRRALARIDRSLSRRSP